MNTKLLPAIVLAVLAVGLVVPTTMMKSVFAPSYLTFIGVNKLSSNDITACSNMQNVAHVHNDGGDGPANVQNCGTAPTDGTIYSRNTVSPYLKILKSSIQNNDQIDLRLFDTGLEEGSLVDEYTYTVHDLDNIGTVQIRLCSGATTDYICASQRVIAEDP